MEKSAEVVVVRRRLNAEGRQTVVDIDLEKFFDAAS
jgi:hypothetical protein